MEDRSFSIKPAALTKALLYGHLSNILLGLMVFGGTHWGLDWTTAQSVAATIAATTLMSLLISVLGTRTLNQPLSELSQQLNELHQKVANSTTALAEITQTNTALLEDLPVGCLVFNKKTELAHGNQLAYKLLGLDAQTHPTSEQVLSALKSLHIEGSSNTVNFTDWLHQSRAEKIHDTKRWPMLVLKRPDNTTACDLLMSYNKNDSHDFELVVLLVDRSEEYDRQEKQMEFISLAAHELRGPITVMRGLIDILHQELNPKLSKEHQELITRMSVAARQLGGYVDNILGVSRIDRDNLKVQVGEADWSQLLNQLSADLTTRAAAHHRKLEFHIPKALPTVAVDSSVILHVINNLVDNAIKYSQDGGSISVSVKVKDNQVETTVQDYGIGIPANVVNNLFTKFYRSHRSKQIVSGTGLGLYLCKAIVEAHGGNIWVRSTEGAGTTFGFTLPTYASVADKIKSGNNESGIIRGSHGWIKNHALYRR